RTSMPMKALAFNCTLKSAKDGETSSTDALLRQLGAELRKLDVETEIIRAVDHDIKPGTDHDMGSGDSWPALREKLLSSDILVMATPVWLGQPSSVAKRVLERIDAFIEELDDKNRMKTFGKVGSVDVVGNEDGAHHVAAEIYQALNDPGFSLPPTAVTYWVGEAMTGKEYSEFDKPPEKVATATAMAAAGAAHLAKVLKANPYLGSKA
ncbi:MAG: NAD(P)H-dependent oxidoreductase, partial [Bradyrhizobium sp.]